MAVVAASPLQGAGAQASAGHGLVAPPSGVDTRGQLVSATSVQRPRPREVVGLLGGAGVLTLVDLGLKALAQTALPAGQVVDLGWISLRVFYNPGVAFSLGASLPAWMVIAGTGLVLAGLVWYLLANVRAMGTVARGGAVLLLGGALGNFVDRLGGAGVVDYLHTGWFPTFNAADVFVTVGVAGLVLGMLREPPSGMRDGDTS